MNGWRFKKVWLAVAARIRRGGANIAQWAISGTTGTGAEDLATCRRSFDDSEA